jgi:hypothetical protein
MQVTYYIWSENEYLGSVKELNYKTALQKAKLVARFNGKATYELTTSYILGSHRINLGSTKSNPYQTKSVLSILLQNAA